MLILRESLIGFIHATLRSTELSGDPAMVKGRLSVLTELDLAFNLDTIRIEITDDKAKVKENGRI